MPPSAATNRPRFDVSAPVNAPRTWPNSSLSSSVPASAPQLTGTNAPPARRPAKWSARATSSLPVPLSPVMSTVASECATLSIVARSWRIAGESPTIEPYARRLVSAPCARRSSSSASARCTHEAELVGRERLADVVARAELHAAHRGVDRRIRGDQQHRGRRIADEQLRQQRHAVLIGQVDVAQHEIEASRARSRRSHRRRESTASTWWPARAEHVASTARGCRARRRRRGCCSRRVRYHDPELDATTVRAVADLDRCRRRSRPGACTPRARGRCRRRRPSS